MNILDPMICGAERRARWLAELETALEQCQILSDQLAREHPSSEEVAETRQRIARARERVEEIRRARPTARPLADDARIYVELATWRGNLD
ncbi:hypothetical protein [Sphingomicrobium lutaoense]|uniref:PH domain-containing protein n=1 Tax=Sphingomicrobium lutaoense TaxID=515949 RepID=A0A839Z3B7_9SPHN|nr:hypothetical protein [Sphingomicrobium lutaoense]MBB3764102.1 hypothetical protein [Sphingomicrobium lutaoense]